MLFTMGHKWRRGESKEVGPDATDWPQSLRVIGRKDDGGLAGDCPALSSLIVPPPRIHSFICVRDIQCTEWTYRCRHTKSNLGCICSVSAV